MTAAIKIESLDPLARYEVMKDLHGPLLTLWKSMQLMDWSALARAMDELDRRAEMALYDVNRSEPE